MSVIYNTDKNYSSKFENISDECHTMSFYGVQSCYFGHTVILDSIIARYSEVLKLNFMSSHEPQKSVHSVYF